jgi:hypothetical protein
MPSPPVNFCQLLAQAPQPSLSRSETVDWSVWIICTFILLIGLLLLIAWNQRQLYRQHRRLVASLAKADQLSQELNITLKALRSLETSPDLVDAHCLCLDYIRMRMDEEVFHYTVTNQIKQKITDTINSAIRSTFPGKDELQVDSCFEVFHSLEVGAQQWREAVLFRLHIKLAQLPTQASSHTINQLLEAVEIFLAYNHPNGQSFIQDIELAIAWDEQAKPIPVLVLQQKRGGKPQKPLELTK